MSDVEPATEVKHSAGTQAAIEEHRLIQKWIEMYSNLAGVYPYEWIAEYCPGGFHPVALGDTFSQGRYIIRCKLQDGGFAIVWMARDTLLERWVAIKIKKARVSNDDPEKDAEVLVLRKLEDRYVNFGDHSKSRGFVQLYDCFNHDGPNGRHTCLVTELLGPSVARASSNYRDEEDQYRPDTILRASRHLLESIDFAHQAGIVHGDISTSNVVFTCNEALTWDDETLCGAIARGAQVARYEGPEPRPASLPAELHQSCHWFGWFDGADEEVRLIDWGGSFPMDTTCDELAQPLNVRAPETYFVGSFDYTHDLWRAGTVIYDLFYQFSMFPVSFGPARAVLLQTEYLGPLPAKWQAKYDEMAKDDKTLAQTGIECRIPCTDHANTFSTLRQVGLTKTA
jgi:serine/threonine protein kinase